MAAALRQAALKGKRRRAAKDAQLQEVEQGFMQVDTRPEYPGVPPSTLGYPGVPWGTLEYPGVRPSALVHQCLRSGSRCPKRGIPYADSNRRRRGVPSSTLEYPSRTRRFQPPALLSFLSTGGLRLSTPFYSIPIPVSWH